MLYGGFCMKTSKRIFSVILSVIVLLSCFSTVSGALYADKEWEDYYAGYIKDNHSPILEPGKDESERNFSWYSESNSGRCCVQISENPDFSGSSDFYGSHYLTADGDRTNKVTVSGLEEDTTYYYRCMSGKTEDFRASFSTCSGDSFTAMYVTDIHVTHNEEGMKDPLMNQSYTFSQVLEKANRTEKLDLVISAGDQATYGLREEYAAVFASPLLRSVPFAPAIGNHDRKGIDYKHFTNNPNQYKKGVCSFLGGDYWYVKGDVLFMVFDSNSKAASAHRNFAKAAVAANPDVKWRVAVCHHDMFGRLTDGREDDAEENRRPVMVPIFDEFKVDLVLLGHSHYYSMSNVLFGGETVTDLSKKTSVTNAEGSVYMVSGSINHARYADDDDVMPQKQCAKAYPSEDIIYNIIDFGKNSVTVKSYTYSDDNCFNTFTLIKTTQNGGHPAFSPSFGDSIKRSALQFVALFEEAGTRIGRGFGKVFGK